MAKNNRAAVLGAIRSAGTRAAWPRKAVIAAEGARGAGGLLMGRMWWPGPSRQTLSARRIGLGDGQGGQIQDAAGGHAGHQHMDGLLHAEQKRAELQTIGRRFHQVEGDIGGINPGHDQQIRRAG